MGLIVTKLSFDKVSRTRRAGRFDRFRKFTWIVGLLHSKQLFCSPQKCSCANCSDQVAGEVATV